MLPEHLQRHDLQDGLVGGGQDDGCSCTVVVGASPVHRCHAPAVAGRQSREAVLGPWRGQVVADAALVVQELGGDDRADGVTSQVFRAGPAAAVTEEPGDRIRTARLQVGAKTLGSATVPSSPPVGTWSLPRFAGLRR